LLTWKFLHVVSMFAGVTLLIGGTVYFEALVRTRHAPTIARFGKSMKPYEVTGVTLVTLGVISGLIYGKVGGFGLGSPWLVFAYVMVGLLFVLGPLEGAMIDRIFAAAMAGDTERMNAGIDDRRRRVLTVTSMVIYVVVIYDMVKKPF
jgi:uncharacterized membrane protein